MKCTKIARYIDASSLRSVQLRSPRRVDVEAVDVERQHREQILHEAELQRGTEAAGQRDGRQTEDGTQQLQVACGRTEQPEEGEWRTEQPASEMADRLRTGRSSCR